MDFFKILTATIPVFLIVGIGYLTRWIGIINDRSETSIMRLVLIVLYPCFILSKVPGSEALQDVSLVVASMLIGFCITVAAFAISYGGGKLFKIDPDGELNTFSVSTAIQNYGFLPIPLIIAMFPETEKETLGVLFIHNLGLEIAMWTIGIVILSGTAKGSLGRLINGPTIGICLGLFLNFTGLFRYIPEPCNQAISQLGNCSIPISLILVGAALAGVIEREKLVINWRVILGSSLIRFLVMPCLFLLVACQFQYSQELTRVLIIEAAMPTAIFPIVLAKHFGGKAGIAVQIVIATSIGSLLMTPLIISWGFKMTGIMD